MNSDKKKYAKKHYVLVPTNISKNGKNISKKTRREEPFDEVIKRLEPLISKYEIEIICRKSGHRA